MNKKINISVVDKNSGWTSIIHEDDKFITESYYLGTLSGGEYSNVYVKHEVTPEEFENALDTITTWFMQNGTERIEIDLDERNAKLAPVKEMTIEEIEKELGHKIKIIK